MSDVNYIKQKAIEIANNSLHKIISGVMNQQESNADCSFDTFEAADGFVECDDAEFYPQFASLPSLISRIARDERRRERKEIRLAKRKNY